jgi:hypothetical protein
MDRPTRLMAGCSLALLIGAAGCRSTRPEVPPGRAYTGDGRQVPTPSVSPTSNGFGSEAHPPISVGTTYPAGVGGGATPGQSQYGTPAPGAGERYGAPTGNIYGPPGSSPLAGGTVPTMPPPPAGISAADQAAGPQ